jgi:hypothetical protein
MWSSTEKERYEVVRGGEWRVREEEWGGLKGKNIATYKDEILSLIPKFLSASDRLG